MNTKRFTGFVCFIIGLILIVFSMYTKSHAKHDEIKIDTAKEYLPKNSLGYKAEGQLDKIVASSHKKMKFSMYAGLLFMGIGSVVLLVCPKKRTV